MDLIQQIYHDAENKRIFPTDIPEVEAASAAMYGLLEDMPYNKFNDFEDAFLHHSAVCEEKGFTNGFKYAMRLLCECMRGGDVA